jgi:maltooligosyltrehalose trehalohydrolase
VSNGRRREFEAFGWRPEAVPDPQAKETFEVSRLDFSEIDRPEHGHVLRTYRSLVALRKDVPQLSSPDVRAHADAYAGTLLLQRERSLVAFNFASEPRNISLGNTGLPAPTQMVFQTEGAKIQGAELHLPPNALAVLVTAP